MKIVLIATLVKQGGLVTAICDYMHYNYNYMQGQVA